MLRSLLLIVATAAVIVAAVFLLTSEVPEAHSTSDPDERGGAELPRKVDTPQRAVLRPNSLARQGRILVRVRSSDDGVVPDAVVRADEQEFRTDAQGTVSLDVAPAVLRIVHDEYVPWVRYLTDQDVEKGSVSATLAPAGALGCEVVDEAGKPVANAEVRLYCGGAQATGESNGAPALWTDSLRPTSDGRVVYARSARCDPNGRAVFRGLATGVHEALAVKSGYVSFSLLAGEWTRAVEQVQVAPGMNQVRLVLQNIYAQAVVIENDTNLPKDAFDAMIYVSSEFHPGMTDLIPSMQAAIEAARKKVKEVVGSEEYVYVGLARAQRAITQKESTPVVVNFYPDENRRVESSWVRVAEFTKAHAKRVKFSQRIPTGNLRVSAPFDVVAHFVRGNKPGLRGFFFHATEGPGREFVVPAGRYCVQPTSWDLLSKQERARNVEVKAGERLEIDFSDAAPISTLRFRVKDAAGGVSSACQVKVAGNSQYKSVRPTDGLVQLRCEPGEYHLRVSDDSLTVVWEKLVTLTGGKDEEFEVTLPR